MVSFEEMTNCELMLHDLTGCLLEKEVEYSPGRTTYRQIAGEETPISSEDGEMIVKFAPYPIRRELHLVSFNPRTRNRNSFQHESYQKEVPMLVILTGASGSGEIVIGKETSFWEQ